MSLFQCEKCGVIENTALTSGYVGFTAKDGWAAEMRTERGLAIGGKYCSLCFDGKWHDRFPRELHPLGTAHTNRDGNIEFSQTAQRIAPERQQGEDDDRRSEVPKMQR